MSLRKFFLFWLVLAGLLYLGYRLAKKPVMEHYYVKSVKMRVETMLNGLMEHKNATEEQLQNYEQAAICQWWRGINVLFDLSELNTAYNQFNQWKTKAGIVNIIGSYRIIDAKIVEGAPVPTCIVSGLINGKPFLMRVPKDQPISWEGEVAVGGGSDKRMLWITPDGANMGEKPKKSEKQEDKGPPMRQVGPNSFVN